MPPSSDATAPGPARPDRSRVLDSVLPIALFLVLDRLWGLAAGVAGATAWSVKAAVGRRRRGEAVGRFLPLLVAYLVVRAAIGIITDSEAVFFGIGIGTKAAIGAALVGTVVAGRPWLAGYAHLVVPFDEATRAHPRFTIVMGRLTVATGCWQFLTSAWDIWLFNRTGSAGGYVLIRFLVGWPAGTLATLVAFAWADRALRPIPGFPGILDLLVPPEDAEDDPGEAPTEEDRDDG